MKAVSLVVVMSLIVSWPALAGKHAGYSPLTPRKVKIMKSCDLIEAGCERRHPDHATGCGVLLQAAKTSGGVWGMPSVRERAQIKGKIVSCSL